MKESSPRGPETRERRVDCSRRKDFRTGARTVRVPVRPLLLRAGVVPVKC